MARSVYEDIRIGPFTGGLNTLSDQTSIGDEELYELINFELDKDGSLVSRPPITKVSGATLPGAGTSMKILGYYTNASTQAYYLIASDRVGKTYYYASGVWTLITDTFAATACIQFRDRLYLVAPLSSVNPSGKWTPSGGFSAEANMPKGAAIVANKDRLWIAQGKTAPTNGSRVYVSDIVSNDVAWNGNFINVSQGDGQNVVDLAVYYSDLIVFKQNSTYRFSFGTDPATGAIERVSANVGATETGCYAAFENRLFVLFNNSVYEFTNYVFDRLNSTVPLRANTAATTFTETAKISAWSDRLFVAYFDVCYVYNIRTRTWSKWESTNAVTVGPVFPIPYQQNEKPAAYLYSTQPLGSVPSRELYKVVDAVEAGVAGDTTTTELMQCTMLTKNYDYQSPAKFKRLRMWMADTITKADIQVVAKPVQYGRMVTWEDLETDPAGPLAPGYSWDDISMNTWDQPLDKSVEVADSVQIEDVGDGRKLVKFLKSLRFRQISYQITAETYGNTDTAPVRIFSLITPIREKQGVSKKVS